MWKNTKTLTNKDFPHWQAWEVSGELHYEPRLWLYSNNKTIKSTSATARTGRWANIDSKTKDDSLLPTKINDGLKPRMVNPHQWAPSIKDQIP